ncbi:MAG: hypothetical protein AAF556_08615 [Pseudomonadota bacterium]
MLDRFGFRQGLSEEELRLPPSNDFAPVARHLTEAIVSLRAVADDPPGTAPKGLMGPFYRLVKRNALKRITAALAVGDKISRPLSDVVSAGDQADTVLRERVRQQLEEAQPILRKGLEGLGSYYSVLLDDSRSANRLRNLSRRLMVSINKVTEERFNFGAVFDWLENNPTPDMKLLPPPDEPAQGPDAAEEKPAPRQVAAL